MSVLYKKPEIESRAVHSIFYYYFFLYACNQISRGCGLNLSVAELHQVIFFHSSLNVFDVYVQMLNI